MGWGNCGKDSKGRAIGYAFNATCDHVGCNAKIDRGLSYACGGMHGETEHGCEGYFCAKHMSNYVDDGDRIVCVCNSCAKELVSSGEWINDDSEGVLVRSES
ncbi:hypothetical protein [Vibrio aestuarianus]|uniref:Uncharacterized protein n=1 Tax=Vibrio aestuarianus TaxID=28171 RepID=A0ABD7YRZ9_9VIBR|nr:hypothetical protein [Vibrio aestuarianus]WGK87247.1 hypothetical protein PYE67_14075 [Vibrio aestuarianus]CAH8235233.1 conserved hypothetical protein [Vibrio aestuarianus]